MPMFIGLHVAVTGAHFLWARKLYEDIARLS